MAERARKRPGRPRKTHAIQAVTIRKSHPQVEKRNGRFAARAAERHTEGRRVRRVEETKNTYRAQVRPKECFLPGTYRTQRRGKHVRVTYAKIDPETFKRRKACR